MTRKEIIERVAELANVSDLCSAEYLLNALDFDYNSVRFTRESGYGFSVPEDVIHTYIGWIEESNT